MSSEEHFERAALDAEAKKLQRTIATLRGERRSPKGEVKSLEDQLEEATQIRDIALGITADDAKPLPDISINYDQGEATVVALLSDVHVGARVTLAETNGLNEFNETICIARLKRWAEALAWTIDMWRSRFQVEDLLLGCIGDMLEGMIHEELKSHNTMTPLEEVQFWVDVFVPIFRWLLNETGLERVLLYQCDGNHGRMTRKLHAAGRANWSLTHLAYYAIRRALADDTRVRCIVSTGHRDYIKVYRWTFRFEHGDSIRYGGGVGGLAIPFNKYVYRLNQTKYADHTCVGHFHDLQRIGSNIVNGTVKGYDAFSAKLGFPYQPPQQWCGLVHHKRGLEIDKKLVLDEDMRRAA